MKFSLFLFFTGEILHKCYSYDDKGGAATSNDSAHHRAFQREKLIEYVFGEEGQHPLMKKIALEHNENDFEKRAVETINNIRSSGCSCIDCQRSIITYETNWSDSFNEQGWSYAVKGFMTGLYRNNKGLYRSGYAGWDNDHIFRLEEVESKDAPSQYSTFVDCYNANWWDSFDINNSWSKCKTGYYMTGLYRSGSMNSDYYGQSLHNIEESRCCRPVNAKEEWGQCYEQSVSFVNKGWSKCKDGYYMAGMYRGNGDFLHNIQTFFCCKMGPLSSKPKCCSKPTHHPTPKPSRPPTPIPTHHPTPKTTRPPTHKPTLQTSTYEISKTPWKQIDGRLRQITVSGNGNHVWGINSGGHYYYRNGVNGSWKYMGYGVTNVSISADGNHVWIVNKHNHCYYRNGGNGALQDMGNDVAYVSVSGDGNHVLILDKNDHIYYRNGASGAPRKIGGLLRQICVSADGYHIWGINKDDYIYAKILKPTANLPTRPPTPKPSRPPTPIPTHHPTPMHDLSLKRNHLYTTINGYSKEWVLSFKLNPKSTRKNWNSIIRFTSTNNDYGGYGDRWLGLWFEANSYTLHVVAGTTDSHNRYRNVDGVQKGIDNDIEIMGVGDVIKVYVNGNLKDDTMLNINRPSVQELKVYASDKFYEPADATLKDFSFIFNLPTRPPTPKQTQAPVQACSGIVKPGGDVRTFFSVQMGRTSGWFHMSYEFLRVKDRIQVSYEGKTLYDTKTFISGCHRNIKVSYGPGTSTKVDFLVTSQDSGTLWYVATSCPSSTELPNVCR